MGEHLAPRRGVIRSALAAVRQIQWATPRVAFALAMVVVAALVIWAPRIHRPPRSAFALAAVEAHERHLHGGIPLGIQSSSPASISNWFQGKIPVHVSLPTMGEMPGHEQPYRIEGAGMVTSRGIRFGYISYRLGH